MVLAKTQAAGDAGGISEPRMNDAAIAFAKEKGFIKDA
jgi:hypothetical protein